MILRIANKENQLKAPERFKTFLVRLWPRELHTKTNSTGSGQMLWGQWLRSKLLYIAAEICCPDDLLCSLIMLSQMISFSSAVGVTNEDKAS